MPVNKKNKKKYLDFRADELNSALLYGAMAEREKDERISELYLKLQKTEQNHAMHWEEKLREENAAIPEFKPSRRIRILIWLSDRFGTGTILKSAAAGEKSGSSAYAKEPGAMGMARTEKNHELILKQLEGGFDGRSIARLEGRHKTAGGNALRAAVLGASDGLLSNFNLLMGVAGASLAASSVASADKQNMQIIMAGMAGLLAGAISMALGEWISVQSSRELYENQIQTEEGEILENPEEEIEELALIYQSRGLDQTSAKSLAAKIMSSPDTALDHLVRDELGIDPDELGGSAWEAAITSFLLFALGAIIPLVPFFFTNGTAAISISAAASAVGLFGIGAAITIFTGRSVLYSGFRQVIFGLIAAAATFSLGHIIGTAIG